MKLDPCTICYTNTYSSDDTAPLNILPWSTPLVFYHVPATFQKVFYMILELFLRLFTISPHQSFLNL